MRKILGLAVLVITILSFSMIALAQSGNPTANEIFNKYTEAIGGFSAGEKVTSRVMKGTVEINPAGIKGTFEISSKIPDKSLTVMSLTGLGDILDGFDGTEGWSNSAIQGMRVKEGEELAQTKASSDFYFDFNLAKSYPKATVTGSDKVGDSDVYVVKGDDLTILYFDKQTGFMVRTDRELISPEGKVSAQTYLSDYRSVDGIKQAFHIRQTISTAELIFNVEDIKQNIAIDDAKFSKPK